MENNNNHPKTSFIRVHCTRILYASRVEILSQSHTSLDPVYLVHRSCACKAINSTNTIPRYAWSIENTFYADGRSSVRVPAPYTSRTWTPFACNVCTVPRRRASPWTVDGSWIPWLMYIYCHCLLWDKFWRGSHPPHPLTSADRRTLAPKDMLRSVICKSYSFRRTRHETYSPTRRRLKFFNFSEERFRAEKFNARAQTNRPYHTRSSEIVLFFRDVFVRVVSDYRVLESYR